jgi:hypothetical protein
MRCCRLNKKQSRYVILSLWLLSWGVFTSQPSVISMKRMLQISNGGLLLQLLFTNNIQLAYRNLDFFRSYTLTYAAFPYFHLPSTHLPILASFKSRFINPSFSVSISTFFFSREPLLIKISYFLILSVCSHYLFFFLHPNSNYPVILSVSFCVIFQAFFAK